MRRRLRGMIYLLMAFWVIYLTYNYIDSQAKPIPLPPQPGPPATGDNTSGNLFQNIDFSQKKTIAIAKDTLTRATELKRDMFVESAPYASEALIPEGAIDFDELDDYVERFVITEQSLQIMLVESLTPEVFNQLNRSLEQAEEDQDSGTNLPSINPFQNAKSREFSSAKKFHDYLNKLFGDDLTEEDQALILKYARRPGYFLLADLEARRPLLKYKLHYDQQKLIEDRTAVRMRAMSVKVGGDVGVAGFIKPYSWVDVLSTLKTQKEVLTVLRGVMVLAVNDLGERQESNKGSLKSSVVTLQVTPEQAEKLALAASEGKLSLSLRNPQDTEPGKTRGAVLRDLRNQPRFTGPVDRVTVIRGTERQVKTFRKN